MNATIEANRESIVNAVREWSPAERAALIRDLAETLVEPDEGDNILPGLKAIETEEMRQIRLGWAAERANGTLDQAEDLSWMDDLSQEQIVARLKAEWEENRRRRLAGEIELDHPHPSPYEGLTQEEALAQMKGEWEAKRKARRSKQTAPKPANILAKLYGIASSDVPGPSDEEVEQWLHEHRMAKYG